MKKIINYFFAIIRVTIPALYLLMYMPIWNGRHLRFSFGSPLIVGFMLVEILAMIVSIYLLVCIIKNKSTKKWTVTSAVLTIISLIILCFVGYIFYLNYHDLPVMPTPGTW